MITFEEYYEQRKKQREEAKARETAGREPIGWHEYINRLAEQNQKESDYLQYLLLKGHEQAAKEEEEAGKQKAEDEYQAAFAAAEQAYFAKTHGLQDKGMTKETYKAYKSLLDKL